ncbi:MAG TPA: DmsE family decaheme c-type cytochrome [Pseudacidobacterium sp.]|nr:DmsE family decaheme c-type cytochrome [Pseudacidobacterium sp.]
MRRILRCCVTLLVLSSALWRASTGDAQQAVGHPASGTPNPSDFIGSDTCETCHADIHKKFGENPHSRLALMHGGKGVTCESCHAPGKAHVESGGDVTKIFRFSKATPKAVDDKCLGCHAGAHPNFTRSAHGEADVSCVGCHSIHAFQSEAGLLKVAQPKLCYSCHTDIKPAFAQPFRHRVDEGLINCSDCHDPHGTYKDKGLHSSVAGDAVCVKCHTEKAGPFVYEHPPIKTEGCTSCHFPHGSPNPRLLTRSNVNSLCLQCHSASFNFTAPGVPSFHNQANQYQACTVCHTQVHGSNADSVFFK